MPIEHVYDDGISVDNNMYKTYEKWIDKNKIQRSTLRSGDVVDFGHGAIFVVYAPWAEPLTDKKGAPDLNNNSIVGKLIFGKFSMLFTGDAELQEEKKLIKEQNSRLFSRVLKVGHHGSRTSSSEDFLKSIKPESALISNGMYNKYGHPHDVTLRRLQETILPFTVRIRWDVFTLVRMGMNGKLQLNVSVDCIAQKIILSN